MDFITLMSSGAAGGESTGSPYTMIILLVAMFGIMYLVTIRPQRKRQKEEQAMRDNIEIGDEITTIGGIVGRVITVKDDAIIIETGADRNKMKIARWAVGTNNTANEKLEAERAAAKEAQQAEREARAKEGAEKGKKSRKKSKKSAESED